MRIVVEIDCQNAAFANGERITLATATPEIKRLLERVAAGLDHGHAPPFVLVDINGNTVGSVRRLKSRKK